jgi:hypothetical protein
MPASTDSDGSILDAHILDDTDDEEAGTNFGGGSSKRRASTDEEDKDTAGPKRVKTRSAGPTDEEGDSSGIEASETVDRVAPTEATIAGIREPKTEVIHGLDWANEAGLNERFPDGWLRRSELPQPVASLALGPWSNLREDSSQGPDKQWSYAWALVEWKKSYSGFTLLDRGAEPDGRPSPAQHPVVTEEGEEQGGAYELLMRNMGSG